MVSEVERLFGAPWPYPYVAGVGLQFSSNSFDQAEFIGMVMGACCPMERAIQIATEMKDVGQSLATVSMNIPLSVLIRDLKAINIQIKIVPPAQHHLDRAGYLS